MKHSKTLVIKCPDEPDMEGEWDEEEVESEMMELLGRDVEKGEWIEWIMCHNDVGDYFSDDVVNAVKVDGFVEGVFDLNGVRFNISLK